MHAIDVLIAKLERVPVDPVFISLSVWGQGQQRVCINAHNEKIVVYA
jgi:hypothetical protein